MQDYGVIRKAPGRPHAFTSGGSEGYGRAVDHQPVLKACVGTHAKGHARRAPGTAREACWLRHLCTLYY